MAQRRAPPPDCDLCPRLQAFRDENRARHPEWFNSPVPSFGAAAARLLVVGLAPGLRGANRTGRPFTGDFAGEILYPALISVGAAHGTFRGDADDDLGLDDCRITNTVRCVPPANRPISTEIQACRPFLADELLVPPRPRVVFALGRVAHEAVLKTLGEVSARFPFAHGRRHDLSDGTILVTSYHSSRYNVNTGRVTKVMLEQALQTALTALAEVGHTVASR